MYVNAAVGRGAKMTLEPALDGVLTLIPRPLRFHPESPIPPSSPAQSHFSSARPCLCCWRGHRINVGVCMQGRCLCRPPVTRSVITTRPRRSPECDACISCTSILITIYIHRSLFSFAMHWLLQELQSATSRSRIRRRLAITRGLA
jgi:hypothetical protein